VVEMEKGQLFSLDFLISLIAITAAVGLMIHSIETNTYSQKEFRESGGMKAVAEIASEMLAADSRIACMDARAPPNAIVNCIDSGKDRSHITDFITGSGYRYSLQDGFATHAINEQSAAYANQDFYEVKRTVFINSTGPGDETELTLRVWK
jgi:hypothetical protein